MKERPIIFSAPMIQAIMAGRKTQTRRIIKSRWPFEVGMRLWVKETASIAPPNWADRDYTCRKDSEGRWRHIGYKADSDCDEGIRDYGLKWTPSIFMPRWASRITLEITGVRVERLQEISAAECWAEGIGREGRPLEALLNLLLTKPKISIGDLALRMPDHFEFGDDPKIPTDREKVTWVTPKGVYAALWESIHGPGSWDLNPWVSAVSFLRVEGRSHD